MDTLSRQFGLVIAYLLPGFIALAGIASLSPVVAGWFHTDQATSFGAPVYALLAATAAGMIVSCFRWLLVDPLLVLVGVPKAVFNARALEERPAAINFLIENHYRYFQFYANTLVAVVWSYCIHRLLGTAPRMSLATDVGVMILCAVLFAGSRDALSKHRERGRQLFGEGLSGDLRGLLMTNGADHNQGDGDKAKPSTPAKPKGKPAETPAKPQAPQSGSTPDKG